MGIEILVKVMKALRFHQTIFSIVSSGFPRLYGLATASETYEGENTVLWLQVAR